MTEKEVEEEFRRIAEWAEGFFGKPREVHVRPEVREWLERSGGRGKRSTGGGSV